MTPPRFFAIVKKIRPKLLPASIPQVISIEDDPNAKTAPFSKFLTTNTKLQDLCPYLPNPADKSRVLISLVPNDLKKQVILNNQQAPFCISKPIV